MIKAKGKLNKEAPDLGFDIRALVRFVERSNFVENDDFVETGFHDKLVAKGSRKKSSYEDYPRVRFHVVTLDKDMEKTETPRRESVAAKQDSNSPLVIDGSVKPESRVEKHRAADVAAIEMERYRVEVGTKHGVKPQNLVDTIANEAGLDSEFIGCIQINDDYSLIELPSGMPKFLLKDLRRVLVCNERLNISRTTSNCELTEAPGKSAKKTTERNPNIRKYIDSMDQGELNSPRESNKKERHRNKGRLGNSEK